MLASKRQSFVIVNFHSWNGSSSQWREKKIQQIQNEIRCFSSFIVCMHLHCSIIVNFIMGQYIWPSTWYKKHNDWLVFHAEEEYHIHLSTGKLFFFSYNLIQIWMSCARTHLNKRAHSLLDCLLFCIHFYFHREF